MQEPEYVAVGYDGSSVAGRPAAERPGKRKAATALGVVSLAAAAIYGAVWRPWQLTWGATSEEVARPLPGDDMVPCPTFNATRAISIAAPPEQVWPWLVQ